MSYLGSWNIGDTLTFYVETTQFATGNALDADANPTFRIYQNQTVIFSGSMALLDGGNTAGFYSQQVSLTAGNSFATGSQYAIYKQATVSGVTGASYDTFQILAPVVASVSGQVIATVTGTVVVGTNNDKTGYSLTQTFPSNFSSMSISSSGLAWVNVEKINDTTVLGTGAAGDLWRG
jgi:hypothetical protein